MQRFFVEPHQIDGDRHEIHITGSDVNHIVNVLRMKKDEELWISDKEKEYHCVIENAGEDEVLLHILYVQEPDYELQNRIYLFQGLPKADKMELIIQKAVELGAYSIVPFAAKRSVVKLDQKKAGKKRERWQAIAKGAAEQSKRGIVPQVQDVMSFQEAMNYAKELDVVLVPYELQEGMKATEAVISKIEPGQSVGIFIGPEGGFDESEIEQAEEAGAVPITLGKRILRTETAGLTTLSILMYHLECREQLDDKNIR